MARTIDEMANTIHFIQDHVHVDDVNGQSLMFKKFDTARFEGNA